MSRFLVFSILLLLPFGGAAAQVEFSLGKSGVVHFSGPCGLSAVFPDGTRWGDAGESAFVLRAGNRDIPSRSVKRSAPDRLDVEFDDGSRARFKTTAGSGFVLFRLEQFEAKSEATDLEMGRLALPGGAKVDGTLGRARCDGKFVALSTAAVNVRPVSSRSGVAHSDRTGCSHTFHQVPGRDAGAHAARFTATCNEQGGGWSYRGIRYPKPLDLTGLKAIRAVVHGDGGGYSLKFQPIDSTGAARDTYISINFTGWKEVTVAEAPYDKITKPHEIAGLNIYYNGMPAGKTVETLIDRVEAVCERNGNEVVVQLEDFEDARSSWWTRSSTVLCASATKKFGFDGAAFGILLGTDEKDFLEIMPDFETAAGLPSPRFDGTWNKLSPDIRRSYFFLTNFNVAEFDDALAIAKRGGFDRILILQSSWTRAPGHYEVNTKNFPGGLSQLVETVHKFKDAGFKTGFHFLAASIDPPDTYLTPVPDDRLVYGAETKLAADVAVDATFIPTAEAPEKFPEEDGGYNGKGRVLRIGDELIVYSKRKTEAPFGFEGCRRGHLGTKPTVHAKDSPVRHLVREYGYHMIDLDTDLLQEVAGHFAKIADACDIDFMYFDGSERLQGDHWYYNPKLQKAFYDAVKNKNMLMQGSSYSHYSWHQLARSASADGHGDLKGYLDQRSPGFDWMAGNAMPLDIGWYYAYDVNCTIDMYEYILLATLAYDSSMSLQVSVSAAHRHPFTGELLDKINRYEKLRLSGRLTPELREKIKIDPKLGGKKPEEIAESFSHLRKEYRLLGEPGQERFQRVVYTPWQKISDENSSAWEITVPDDLGTVRVGMNVHLAAETKDKTLGNPYVEIGGRRIALKTVIEPGQYVFHWPGEPVRRYAPNREVEMLPASEGELRELPPGKYSVRFGCDGMTPCRVRVTLQPSETIAIP